MARVAAPWRTATVGHSTSAAAPPGALLFGGGFDDLPNPNQPPTLSVMDSSATAGDIAESAHATSARRAAKDTEPITHSSPKLNAPHAASLSCDLGGPKAFKRHHRRSAARTA